MDIATARLAELGRFIASRTGDVDAAKIAYSTAPQVRYDAIVTARADNEWYDVFSRDELLGLVSRISDPQRRRIMMRRLTDRWESEDATR